MALFGWIIGRILESLCLLGLDQRPAFRAELAEVLLAKDDAVQLRHMHLLETEPRATSKAELEDTLVVDTDPAYA